jgi:hypothetical protein
MIQELITQCEAQALDDAFLNMRRDGVAFTSSDRMDSADVAIACMRNLNGALIQLQQIAAMAHTLGRLVAEYDRGCFDIDLADVAHAIDKAACELDQPDVMDVLEIRKQAALSFRDDERMEQRRAA